MTERKEILIQMSDKAPACYEVRFAGGGEVPVDLQGAWTHQDKAQQAIDDYLAKRDKRSVTSGSTRTKSRAE